MSTVNIDSIIDIGDSTIAGRGNYWF